MGRGQLVENEFEIGDEPCTEFRAVVDDVADVGRHGSLIAVSGIHS